MASILWDVDTQIDFMEPEGKLYVPSADDHELTDAEIADEPDYETTYPPYCLRGTHGARKIRETEQQDPVPLGLGPVPPRYLRGREFLLLEKSFDVFTNPNADALLETLDPDEVVVFGVVTDVCDDAAIRGLDEARTAACQAAWRERGVEFSTVEEVTASLG